MDNIIIFPKIEEKEKNDITVLISKDITESIIKHAGINNAKLSDIVFYSLCAIERVVKWIAQKNKESSFILLDESIKILKSIKKDVEEQNNV